MNARLATMIAVAISSLMLCGCWSTDILVAPAHPVQIERGQIFNVELVDGYVLFSDTSVTREDFLSDSFHLAIAFPPGLSVTSAEFYCNPAFRSSLFNHLDSAEKASLLIDSLSANSSLKQPMSSDPGFAASLRNLNIAAEGEYGPVNASTAQWTAFSAAVHLSFPAGTPVDTFFRVISSDIDSVGLIGVPIYVYLQLRADENADLGPQKIVYYARTTGMDFLQDQFSELPSRACVYYPVTIMDNSGLPHRSASGATGDFGLRVCATSKGVLFNFSSDVVAQSSLHIYDLQGALVQKLNRDPHSSSILWEGTDRHGRDVRSGTYVAKAGPATAKRFWLGLQ